MQKLSLSTRSLLAFPLRLTLDVLNRAFADYAVRIAFTQETFLQMVRYDDVDLAQSQLLLLREQPVGVALLAQRGWQVRLSGMALVPEVRNQGVGTWFMEQILERIRKQGAHKVVLEVLANNAPAIHVYEKLGFKKVFALYGYKGKIAGDGEPSTLEETDIRIAAQQIARHTTLDLPWQISWESLTKLVPPYRAYHLGDAWTVISDPSMQWVNIRSVVVAQDCRRKGQGRRLLATLAKKYPNAMWYIPPLVPEPQSPFFEAIGLKRDTLSQWLMVYEYESA